MQSLIWKELRENVKWAPLPGLFVLLLFLMDRPGEPMPGSTTGYYFCLIPAIFGAVLGFVQIFFEGHGDKRSVLLHRPLKSSSIFWAKVIAGGSLYALALGTPFACLEWWKATPGNIPAPYHWQTSLPWLADILSGLVYYFAGMLVAQRDARWYGSRCLPLAAAFFCSYVVWAVPEFWQALAAILILGLFMAVAAWGSFCTGGAGSPLPAWGKAALGMVMLFGLLAVSMSAKQRIGEWLDPGMHYQVDLDRHGEVVLSVDKEGSGAISSTYLEGHEGVDLKNERSWGMDSSFFEWPVHWGYRHNGRFYVQLSNDSSPGNERWYFDHSEGRLLGFDAYYHNYLGSFGPDGFAPPEREPGTRFSGELRYITNRGQYLTGEYLVLADGVHVVDFARRTIRTVYRPEVGESVMSMGRWFQGGKRILLVVGTDKSFHVLTEDGARVVTLPRALPHGKYGPIFVGLFEDPQRYFVWCHLRYWLREPWEYMNEPSMLFEYDVAGRELARREVPPFPYPDAPIATALFGLVTPMTEAATLVEVSRLVRALSRSRGSMRKPALLDFLEGIQYYIPGTSTLATALSPATRASSGLMAGYIALILLAAVASALGCSALARRCAFSKWRTCRWALIGFFFGWVGFALLLVLEAWPARIACPGCRKLRVVTRVTCEHCGANHALPVPDGTEVFEKPTTAPQVAVAAG
jgi:hypothetical protein